MSWNNNNLMISQDYDLNDACNKLISSCLSLLHKGKLKAFNDILKETVKQNSMVLGEIDKSACKIAKKMRKPRVKKAVRKTKKK